MEKRTAEELRQQLEMLRKNVARKKNKIKKIERSKSAREHVKKKIQEHRDKTTDEDDNFVQHSIQRAERTSGTTKARTHQVSFNLGKNEKVGTCATATDIEIATIQTKVSLPTQHNASASEDEFREEFVKRDRRSKIQPQTGKSHHRVGKHVNAETEIGRRIVRKKRGVSLVRSDEAAISDNTLVTTAVHSSPRVPTTHSQGASKDLIGQLDGRNVAEKRIENGEPPHARVSSASSESNRRKSLRGGHPAVSSSSRSTDSTDLKSRKGISGDGDVPVATVGSTVTENSADLFNDEHQDDIIDQAVTKSPILELEDALANSGGQGKKKQRRSTTELDFSFLDEEGAGDMYSQVKMRHRQSQHSSSYLFDESSALWEISQDIEDPPIKCPSMPRIGQGLSQTSRRKQPPSQTPDQNRKGSLLGSKPHAVKPRRLYSPPNSWPMLAHGGHAQTTSSVNLTLPCSKTVTPPLLSQRPKYVVDKVDRFVPRKSEYDELKGLKMEPPDAVTDSVSGRIVRKGAVESFSDSSQSKAEASQTLIALPPKDILKRHSHFVLPDAEYGSLMRSKIKAHPREVVSVMTKGQSATPSSASKSKSRSLKEQVATPINGCGTAPRRRANRRRSRKLSPIPKVAENTEVLTFPTGPEDSSMVESENPNNSQLNEAMLSEALAIDDELNIQRKVGRNNSQANKDKRGLKSTNQMAVIPSAQIAGLVESGNTPDSSIKMSIPDSGTVVQAKTDCEAEELLNTAHLDESMLIESASQSSSQRSQGSVLDIAVGLHEVDRVQLQWQNETIRSMDAVRGYFGSEPAVLVALASAHRLQLWSQKVKQPWVFLHSWEMPTNEVIEDVQVFGTGDLTTVVITSRTSIVLAGYFISDTAWMSTIHKIASSDSLLCCKTSACILIAEVSACGSDVTRYTMCEDRRRCDPGICVGSTTSRLASLKTIRGQHSAVLGTSQTTVYIWNFNRAVMVAEITLPLTISHCLSAVAERGFVFLWVSMSKDLPYLLAINPSSKKSVVVTTAEEPQGADTRRLGGVCVNDISVAALWTKPPHLSVWDLSGCHQTGLDLPDYPACVSGVQGESGDRILVATRGRLLQFNVRV